MSSYSLAGKVVLITGGGGGLGAATAKHLSRRGARVAVVDIDGLAAARVAAELVGANGIGLQCDVTDADSVRSAAQRITEELGPIDVSVANAGILGRGAPLRDLAPAEIAKVIDVNVNGVLNTVSATLESVVARRGQVVLLSSVFSYINGAGAIPYAMSKAAIEQLGRGLRVELGGHGASVLTAYFSLIDTGMIRNGVDASPGAKELMAAAAPAFLLTRITTDTAAHGIIRGIERRDARLMLPRRWRPLSATRGILGPILDRKLASDPAVHAALARLESPSAATARA